MDQIVPLEQQPHPVPCETLVGHRLQGRGEPGPQDAGVERVHPAILAAPDRPT